MSHFQLQMYSDYDSAESIADSDFQDGEPRKLLVSPLYMQSRENRQSARMPMAPEKHVAMILEREASAKRTQVGQRKSLMLSPSQEPSAPEKLAALFSFRSEEPENQFNSSVFNNVDPSNFGRSPLEGNKVHLPNYSRFKIMKQEDQVESLICCICEL